MRKYGGVYSNLSTMKKLVLVPLIVLYGCSASYRQQRDVKKLQSLVLSQPNEFARLSDLLNPCFSGKAKSDTIITTYTDTLLVQGATTTMRIKDTVFVTKTLPGKLITKTNTVTIHDTITDGRAVNYLNTQLKVKSDSLVINNTQLSQTKKAKNTWMLIAIGALLVIVISLSIKVYKLISTGGLSGLKSVLK